MVSASPLTDAFDAEFRRGELFLFGLHVVVSRFEEYPCIACVPIEGGRWMLGFGPGADRTAYYWAAFETREDVAAETKRIDYFFTNHPKLDFWFDFYEDEEREALLTALAPSTRGARIASRGSPEAVARFLAKSLVTQLVLAPTTVVLIDAPVFDTFYQTMLAYTDGEAVLADDAGELVVLWSGGTRRVACHPFAEKANPGATDFIFDVRRDPSGVTPPGAGVVVSYEFEREETKCFDE